MDQTQHAEVFSWFSHPVYSRFWQHYHQALSWQQRHRRAYRRALAAYAPPPFPWPNPAGPCPPRYSVRRTGQGVGGARGRAAPPSERPARRTQRESDSDADSSSDSEMECDVSSVEITDELRQYFAQTERHREELKEQQRAQAERDASYVPADRDLHRVSLLSAGAPSEPPGQRRAAEMRLLYGHDAAKIQAMETVLQLGFDRCCDRKQPKYWPVIPLKL